MVFSSLFGKESIVGLDIGSRFIKAVEIEPTSNGWEFTNAGIIDAPEDAVKDGVVMNITETAASIRNLLKESGIKATGAVSAISGSQVIVRQVDFPTMTEEALRKSIKYEASRHITSSMDDSVVEFEILGPANNEGHMNVMLVAAPIEMVESRVKVIETAGLEPLAIDVEAFALIKSLVEFYSSDEFLQKTVAILDMGSSNTDVNIMRKGEFALTRNIPIAGVSFSNAIRSLTGKTPAESEELKIEMAKNTPINELGSAHESGNQSWQVVQPLLEELIREIKRSINFYQSQYSGEETEGLVSKIVLTGGSATMPGMDAYISQRLNIPTQVANVFTQTAIDSTKIPADFVSKYGAMMAVAAGLSLKEQVMERKQQVVA